MSRMVCGDCGCTYGDNDECGCVEEQLTKYKLPDPYAYIYEFDSVFGLHQSFSSREYNGSKPSCTVLVYTADQLREEIAKAEQRGREKAAQDILNGSFLHDKSPAKLFANEVAAMLRRTK